MPSGDSPGSTAVTRACSRPRNPVNRANAIRWTPGPQAGRNGHPIDSWELLEATLLSAQSFSDCLLVGQQLEEAFLVEKLLRYPLWY